MKKVLTDMGRAFRMGIMWGLAWAPIGVLAGLIIDPDNSMDEMWVAIGGYPGFLCGLLFPAILAMASGSRKPAELPLAQVGACGAAVGLLVGLVPFVLGTPGTQIPFWVLAFAVIGSITALSTISAITSALILRRMKARAQI